MLSLSRKLLICTALLFIFPTVSFAGDWFNVPKFEHEGYYMELGVGHSFDDVGDTPLLDASSQQDDGKNINIGEGVVGDLRMGFRFKHINLGLTVSQRFKGELRGDFHNGGAVTPTAWFEQNVQSLRFTSDLEYFLTEFLGMKPYLGIGLGGARHELARLDIWRVSNRSWDTGLVNNVDYAFVWKVGAGIEYELKNAFKDNSFLNNWAVKVDYYYMDAGEADSTGKEIVDTGGLRITKPFRYDMRSHEVIALIRYNF
jgi:opacity protein-like surface antigen|tara:strand:- start:182 stop:952 length:771 start_codon:yes stop_codon:yes gene_type:complete